MLVGLLSQPNHEPHTNLILGSANRASFKEGSSSDFSSVMAEVALSDCFVFPFLTGILLNASAFVCLSPGRC